jgi:hypothetical protein
MVPAAPGADGKLSGDAIDLIARRSRPSYSSLRAWRA